MTPHKFKRQLENIEVPYSIEAKECLKQELLTKMREDKSKKNFWFFRLSIMQYSLATFALILIIFIPIGIILFKQSTKTTENPNSTLQAQIIADTKRVEKAVEANSTVGQAEGINVYKLDDGRVAMAPRDLKNFIETHSPYKTDDEIDTYEMNESIDLIYHKKTKVVELLADNQDKLYIDISKL